MHNRYANMSHRATYQLFHSPVKLNLKFDLHAYDFETMESANAKAIHNSNGKQWRFLIFAHSLLIVEFFSNQTYCHSHISIDFCRFFSFLYLCITISAIRSLSIYLSSILIETVAQSTCTSNEREREESK